jgi:hypothetical protein
MDTSFASTRSTSSKRITVASGQEVVRGSDTETDEDLEDLDAILNKNRPTPQPANSASNSSATSAAAGAGRLSGPKSANVVPKERERKRYKFNLSTLLEETKRQTAMEVRIAEAQANLHESSTKATAFQGSPKKDVIKAVLIETKNSEDGGKARRVMDALERTEAFERDDVWHFFEPQSEKLPQNPFPRISHANPMLQTTLNDPQRRRQAFASGFIQRIAQKVPLPDELLVWMLAEVCRETKDVLLSAYIETLHHAVSSTSSCLSPEKLLLCFRALGTKPEALDFQGLTQHTRQASNVCFFFFLFFSFFLLT